MWPTQSTHTHKGGPSFASSRHGHDGCRKDSQACYDERALEKGSKSKAGGRLGVCIRVGTACSSCVRHFVEKGCGGGILRGYRGCEDGLNVGRVLAAVDGASGIPIDERGRNTLAQLEG